MSEERYSDYITHPLDADTSIDGCSDEDKDIAFLEEQMMKYGSLHENTMDWQAIEKTCLTVLAEKCKSLRVLSYLLLALQNKKDGSSYILSIHLLGIFLQHFWVECHPQPGEKGLVRKRKMLRQIMMRTEQASEALRLSDVDSNMMESLSKELGGLGEELTKAGYDFDSAHIITSNCQTRLNETLARKSPTVPVQQTQASSTTATTTSSHSETVSSPELGDIRIDSATERETKQSLFKVASFLCTMDGKEALGYRLRRFALWSSISSMPPEKDGKTEMMSVPQDRVTEYLEMLSKPTPELLDRIEQSVAASPFWVSGNYLASQAAYALSRNEVAQGILEETRKFTSRLPKIMECSFSDGTPFADDDTRNWLNSSAEGGEGQGSALWNETLAAALKLAKKGDFKQGLILLEEGMAKAVDLREQSYWRLVTADFMSKMGMKTLGQSKYEALSEMVKGMDMSVWEPSFTKSLSTRLPKSHV